MSRMLAVGVAAALMTQVWNAQAAIGKTWKVFVLAGQSNMGGKASMSLLKYQANDPETAAQFAYLKDGDDWKVWDDVFIKFREKKGRLTVGYGYKGCIGPELGFGSEVGNHFDAPVLLIKTAWGGRDLYHDFRSPSAEYPPDTKEEAKDGFGRNYRMMIEEVTNTLANLEEIFPENAGAGYELSGFVWFQGWNDAIKETKTAEYTDNLIHFIKDVRKSLDSPNLPFVIGQVGFEGKNADEKMERFKTAQAEAAAPPEFKGNVILVKTDMYWDEKAAAVLATGWREHIEEWRKVGSDYGYHYLGSVKTYLEIGKALGRGAIELNEKH